MRRTMGLVAVMLAASAGVSQGIVWDFETGTAGWSPRAKTVTVERVEGLGATKESKSCLHVRGVMETAWNYAVSGEVPMKAGQLYRLSAWLRVDKLDEATVIPFLKCEFVADDPDLALGRANTTAYDELRMGRWQRVFGEFRAPEKTTRCWVALEKGGDTRMEVDAYLDDVVLEPIEAAAIGLYRLAPAPAGLEKVKGRHPRLYLNPQRIAELREAIKTTHAGLWEEVRRQADDEVRRGPPAYLVGEGYASEEQLWQRDVGNTMPLVAMAYVLTGDRKYLASARDWALASCGYKTWGLGRTDGMDLAAGHQLFGLAIVYDWCYQDLDDAARQTIRETLSRRAKAMYEAAAMGQVWWHKTYLQNHLWVNICGLGAAGFALYGEVDDASSWIGLALDKFQRTMEALGDDGASQEGVDYWQYGVEYMMKFMHPARELLGVNLYDHPWWRNTATYWQYLALPRASWQRGNVAVDIADSERRWNWYGPDYLLRGLAREYRDAHAQWSGAEVDRANVESPCARWLNLLWFDPTLESRDPSDLPTLHHFTDLDIVSARSDWSGSESLVVFKCGPFVGHKAVQRFRHDPGGGHVHPDANHFVVFGCGEWLLRDDGYADKWTRQHNTLLIEGKGQIGEGERWFDGSPLLALRARPRVSRAVSTAALDHMTGDATAAYPREAGLQRYVRHLLWLKPNVLIVVDDIVVDKPRALELRFHPEPQKAVQEKNAYICAGKKAVLRLEPLTTDGVQVSAEDVPALDGPRKFSMFTVSLRRQVATPPPEAGWRNAVALSWSEAGAQPAVVTLQGDARTWAFKVANRTVVFDWDRGEARVVAEAPRR